MSSVVDSAKSTLGLAQPKGTYTLPGSPIPTGTTGYGLMGLTWRPNPCSQEQAFSAMQAALAEGANLWNGGEFYGPPERNSLHLLNEYYTKYPEDAKKTVICIKGGGKPGNPIPDGSEQNTQRSIDECLKVLDGKHKLDFFECARVDPKTPIEITMGAIKKYIDNGKLGGVCLSECSADSIRRAAAVVKISGVEIEYSLFENEVERNGVLSTCAELDIPVVAYSPLGRGFLTGQVKSRADIPEDSYLNHVPRFNEENFPKNIKLVHQLEDFAERKKVTPGQVAVAWVKAQSERNGNPVIIPIPGATTAERVKENCVDVELSDMDLKEIESIIASIDITGERYPPGISELCFGNSPPLKD
ncbi:hypothetical protein B0A48_02771 [Cryoendolithus antarcticus]|uniref:NADP-dependent oxidoreductase domain-containing protein n=1 Tax=Cryoendolithus antarcticus TaxID=1507870 RepID=A0A1V8TLK0_9PEZI|nr:hypothetical protein B0A48_02771 [Cryoendolithus antarcticus]